MFLNWPHGPGDKHFVVKKTRFGSRFLATFDFQRIATGIKCWLRQIYTFYGNLSDEQNLCGFGLWGVFVSTAHLFQATEAQI